MMFARITHTSFYLPEKIVTNDELPTHLNTSHEWIVTRTGICARHMAAEDETTSVLAYQAARQMPLEGTELIIVATTTPDHPMPSTAVLVQHKLGLKQAAAFDVQAVCGGFIYGLSIADQFIRSGKYRKILVIGADTMTRICDWNDRSTCVLFGDGAGAVLVEASTQPGIIDFDLYADGAKSSILYADPLMKMRGSELFRCAVDRLGSCIESMLQKYPEPLDWIVPHQANLRIIKGLAERFGLPMEKMVVNIESCANTSAASIPIAFSQAVQAGKIQPGHRVLLEGIGAGLVWGCVLLVM